MVPEKVKPGQFPRKSYWKIKRYSTPDVVFAVFGFVVGALLFAGTLWVMTL